MKPEELTRKYTAAVEELNQHEHRKDGATVVESLNRGLTILRDCLYSRLHEDVERIIGRDSILIPVSEKKSEMAAKTQIEIYQIVESALAAREFGYLRSQDDWYLQWLCRLRLSDVPADPRQAQRVADYLLKSADDRRLAFTDVLARTFPESRRAPLVLFRLLPLALQLATALAFGDHDNAFKARGRQATFLPAISDCRQCHGKVLENTEVCRTCGNPLWKSEWLVATD